MERGAAEAIQFVIGGVPAGGPYTIELNGTASKDTPCVGASEAFSVTAGVRESLNVSVQCKVATVGDLANVQTGSLDVSGAITMEANPVDCPGIEALSANPTFVYSTGWIDDLEPHHGRACFNAGRMGFKRGNDC